MKKGRKLIASVLSMAALFGMGVVALVGCGGNGGGDKSQQVVDAAITLMYKSYFKTGNEKFLTKLDQLLKVQENLTNGNLKLQLVAHML